MNTIVDFKDKDDVTNAPFAVNIETFKEMNGADAEDPAV
jgi:hypothetical protein